MGAGALSPAAGQLPQAIVLAGSRGPDDAVAAAAGVPTKVLAPLGGRAVLLRVLDALRERVCAPVLLSGPPRELFDAEPELHAMERAAALRWLAPGPSPSGSAALAFEQTDSGAEVLLTTADHGLLTGAVVDEFLAAAARLDAEVCVGLAALDSVQQFAPELPRTGLNFSDGRRCGCNLFLLRGTGAQAALRFWQQLESQRKQPHRLDAALGAGVLLRYALGRLSLADAFVALSQRSGARCAAVPLAAPQAAVDVDSVADWAFADRWWRERAG